MPVTVTKDRVASVMAAIDKVGDERVLIGIPAEEALRKPDPDEKGPPANNAMLGFIHEFGSPAANIPARPFLIPGVSSAADQIGDIYEGALRRLLDTGENVIDAANHAVGLAGQTAVKARILSGDFVPLSPVTLAKRAARGFKGTRILVETAQLLNSITYAIRRRGD